MYVVVFVFPGDTPDHTFYVSFPSGQQGFARPLSQCLSPGFVFSSMFVWAPVPVHAFSSLW